MNLIQLDWVGPGGINIFGKMSQFEEELQLNGNNIEGKVDKMALPPFEEHKLCPPTSNAQFQITLSTAALLPHTGEKSDYIEGKYCYSQINLRCALQVFLFMGLLWAIKMARAGWEGPLI